jgi:hypothetical protein
MQQHTIEIANGLSLKSINESSNESGLKYGQTL